MNGCQSTLLLLPTSFSLPGHLAAAGIRCGREPAAAVIGERQSLAVSVLGRGQLSARVEVELDLVFACDLVAARDRCQRRGHARITHVGATGLQCVVEAAAFSGAEVDIAVCEQLE